MPGNEWVSLWHALSHAPDLAGRAISDPRHRITFETLKRSSALGGQIETLRGRSVLLAAEDHLAASLALIELDGVARRIVLCPPDLSAEHLRAVAAIAEVDAAVVDAVAVAKHPLTMPVVTASTASLHVGPCDRTARHATEWILLTSGTSGVPKLVQHSLASLAHPITGATVAAQQPVWSTFYDIRRYGGLQIFLRAVLGGGSMVLSCPREAVAEFLARAGAAGVTHISGTPSHWRRASLAFARGRPSAFNPRYVRLSGEIADQAVLDLLAQAFPDAGVAHAFAATEAGVAFDVGDGRAGFPASLLGRQPSGVEMKVVDGTLRVRSPRTATRYLGPDAAPMRDADGFVDTGDEVVATGDRYHFAGRRGGIVNVGGLKVHPEEVEAVINRHPAVRMSLVRARRSPITGAVVVADVVIRPEIAAGATAEGAEDLARDILDACRQALPPHKVPVMIRIVPSLPIAAAGKLVRTKG